MEDTIGPEGGDYAKIARAIRLLGARYPERTGLDVLAAEIGLSPEHFQRVFSRWAGVSPKRFLQAMGAEHASALLRSSRPILDTAFALGVSSGRLHDLLVTVEAATPGEIRSGGAGLRIRVAVRPTRFGDALCALTDRGVCALSFVDGGDRDRALADLRRDWPAAEIVSDDADDGPIARTLDGLFPEPGAPPAAPLTAHVRGTNFQIQVWRALLRVPSGAVTTYEDLAARLGRPSAVRAVGGALARNPVAILIPCHRVIHKTALSGAYRWGAERKRLLLGREQTLRETPEPARLSPEGSP